MDSRLDDLGSLQEGNVRVRSLELAGEADKIHQPIKSGEDAFIPRFPEKESRRHQEQVQKKRQHK